TSTLTTSIYHFLYYCVRPFFCLSLLYFFFFSFFFFNDTATTEIYTLSLHDALPICLDGFRLDVAFTAEHELVVLFGPSGSGGSRSEEHTSELQSRFDLVCRLLLEKKKQRQS